LWPHSSNSHLEYSQGWEGAQWAGPDVVPSLVALAALLQLRSLLAEVSQDSSASARVVDAEEYSAAALHDVDVERL